MAHSAQRKPKVLTSGLSVLIVLSTATGLSSCGFSASSPRGVTQNFISAMQDKDWEAACQSLSQDFIHRHMNGDSRFCVNYLEQWHGGGNTFEGMSVPSQETETRSDGTLVTVDLADGSTDRARVVDQNGELKLSRYPGQDRGAR
ncbi:hypothetical protein [Kocuria sp.]|uniref:hypothetical protein n=1 Tax=Kocuria sp. TaxID=1871328 RepID=UPI0026DF61BE|nr:hypothetical protein [Kocuria sp.]MDO5619679.1 hypothetical protein [Kocuria sp.]